MTFGRAGSILGLLVLTSTVPLSWRCSALPHPPQVGLHSGPAPVYSREGLPRPRISSGVKSEGKLVARRMMVRLFLAQARPSHRVIISGANIINLPSPGAGQDSIWWGQVRNINNFKATFLFSAPTLMMNTANQGSNSHNSNNGNVNTVSSSNIVSNFNTNNANVVNILPSPG